MLNSCLFRERNILHGKRSKKCKTVYTSNYIRKETKVRPLFEGYFQKLSANLAV